MFCVDQTCLLHLTHLHLNAFKLQGVRWNERKKLYNSYYLQTRFKLLLYFRLTRVSSVVIYLWRVNDRVSLAKIRTLNLSYFKSSKAFKIQSINPRSLLKVVWVLVVAQLLKDVCCLVRLEASKLNNIVVGYFQLSLHVLIHFFIRKIICSRGWNQITPSRICVLLYNRYHLKFDTSFLAAFFPVVPKVLS